MMVMGSHSDGLCKEVCKKHFGYGICPKCFFAVVLKTLDLNDFLW